MSGLVNDAPNRSPPTSRTTACSQTGRSSATPWIWRQPASLFSLALQTKKPTVEHRFLDASTDPAVIRAIFGRTRRGPDRGPDRRGQWLRCPRLRLPARRQSLGRRKLYRLRRHAAPKPEWGAPSCSSSTPGLVTQRKDSRRHRCSRQRRLCDRTSLARLFRHQRRTARGMARLAPSARDGTSRHTPRAADASVFGPYVPTANTRLEGYRVKVLDTLRQASEGQKHYRLRNAALSLGGIAAEAGFSDATAVEWLLAALPPDGVKDWNTAEHTAQWGLAAGRDRPFVLKDRPRSHSPYNGATSRPEGSPSSAHDDGPTMSRPQRNTRSDDADTAQKSCENNDEGATDDSQIILKPSAPLICARAFVRAKYTAAGMHTLVHQKGLFYAWEQTHYAETDDEDVRASAYAFFDKALRPVKGGIVPFDPNRSKIANILEATAAETQLPSSIHQPAWLDTEPHPPATAIIACTNGLLHLPTRNLLPLTPAFFAVNALAYDYQPNAPEPAKWLAFLKTLWPEDQDAINTLQEIFGLLLTGDTRRTKKST